MNTNISTCGLNLSGVQFHEGCSVVFTLECFSDASDTHRKCGLFLQEQCNTVRGAHVGPGRRDSEAASQFKSNLCLLKRVFAAHT